MGGFVSQTCSQIIHAVCGYPSDERCGEARGNCYVCGGVVSRGISVREWMLDSYTDQNRVAVPSAEFVCEGCCFVMARCSPVPGRPPKDGKQFGGNFRNYSHMYEQGAETQYVNASKGEKPAIREFLAREHRGQWFAAIADSGQKHVLPYTPINPPGRVGLVLFDEALVTVGDPGLVDVICQLLTDGATKDEIARRDYRPATWQRLGKDRIRAFERDHGRNRGHWFGLALWLAQRDESEVSERLEREKQQKEEEKKRGRKKPERAARKPANRVHRDDAGRLRPVGEGEGANVVLGPDPKSDPKLGANQCNSVGIRDQHPKKDAPRSAVQLGLFGGN